MRAAVPTACVLAALLALGSATRAASAQATPETPGPDGAEAAVTALVEAQRVGDWTAVVGLLDPEVVADLGDFTRQLATNYRNAIADSAAIADSLASMPEPQEIDLGLAFRAARQLLAVVPVGAETLTDAEIVARVLAADASRSFSLYELGSQPPYRVRGSVAESDTLVRVLAEPPPGSAITQATEPIPMHWTGTAWTVRLEHLATSPLLEYLRFSTHNWEEVLGHILEVSEVHTEMAPVGDE